jgi:hypothetical protein
VISRHGAVIALNRKLAAQQELTIRCVGKRRETKARVVGMIGGQGDEFVYGIALLDPAMNLWDVEFPQLTGTEEPLSRMLLKCSACGGREVVHLNEIEIQVFAANQRIERFCQSCSATTPWKQESKPAEGELDVPWAKQESGGRSTVAPPTRARDKRKHNRVKTNVSACIRQIGFPDEVVVCEDLSRGVCVSEVASDTSNGPRSTWPFLTQAEAEIFLSQLESYMSTRSGTATGTAQRT